MATPTAAAAPLLPDATRPPRKLEIRDIFEECALSQQTSAMWRGWTITIVPYNATEQKDQYGVLHVYRYYEGIATRGHRKFSYDLATNEVMLSQGKEEYYTVKHGPLRVKSHAR